MTRIQKFVGGLKGKNIHVTGISGIEGSEVALFLSKHGIRDFHVHDFSDEREWKKHFRESHFALTKENREERMEKIAALPVTFHFKDTYLQGIEDADIVFVPQSWYLYKENEKLHELEKKEKLMHITKLYFNLFPGKIIAVTGSTGKTTTTNIIAEIFQCAKEDKKIHENFFFTGNDRRMDQMLTSIENAKEADWLILEVSNRQLRIDLGVSPCIGVITNITPNHLNEYVSWDDYKKAKESLLKYQTMSETAVLNYDDPELQRIIERGDYNVFGFSAKTDLHSGAFLKNGKLVIRHGDEELVICKREDMLIPGEHNISNALAACAACFTAKIPLECMREALKRFPGVPQRLELIREWRSRRFFNDTAATTPESVLAAVSSFDSPVILIMGGGLKGGDYGILKESLKKVKKIILLKSPLSEHLKKNLNLGGVIETDTLKKALLEAWKISKEDDVILLSPGGEYFSYFRDKMPGYKNIRTFVEQIV